MKSLRNGGVVWCAIASVGLGLTGCDRIRSADTIAARGEQNIEQGNYRSAMGDFRTVLERKPDHVAARVGLARAQLQLGDFEGALTTLEILARTVELDAAALEIKYRALLFLGRFDAVLETGPLEAKLPEIQKSLFAAKAHLGLRQHEAAEKALARALSLAADDNDVRTTSALLAIEKRELSEALRILDEVLTAAPESADALFAKGRAALGMGDVKTAKNALEAAEQFGKRTLNWREQAQLFALLTEIALADRSVEDATRWLEKLNSRLPQNPLSQYLQARLALLKENVEEAVAQLQKATQSGDYVPASLLLASVHMTRGNFGQAETELNRLLTKQPNNPEARKLLAQLYLQTNRVSEARRILPDGSDGAADAQLDWLRGQTLFALGAHAEGIELLEKTVAADKNDVPKTLQLARAYMVSGERAKAVALLESLPAEAGGAQRQALLVLASVSGKSPSEGVREIEGLLGRHANDSMLHAAAGALVAQYGNVARAIEILTKAVALDGGNVDGRMTLASVLVSNGRVDLAEAQLHEVVALDSKRWPAYSGLANIALARSDKAQAIKFLEQAVGADPAAIEPRMQMAQLALADQNSSQAHALLDEAVLASNDSPTVLNAAGTLLYQARQYDDALIRFERAAAAGDVQAAFNAAQVQLALGRRDEARRRLGVLETDKSTQLRAASALARMDVEDGKVDSALNRVRRLKDRAVGPEQVEELEGDIYFAAQQWGSAQTSFERAYRRTPSQRLAMKRFQAGLASRSSSAAEPLREWLRRTPSDLAARRMLAKFLVGQGQYDSAIREYEAWLNNAGNRDPEMVNDLAWLYGEKGDARALPLAREAYEASSARPEIADTYGWLLLGQNRQGEALSILEKAAAAAPENGEIQYHYSVALARNGKTADAQRILTQLLSGKAEFPSRAAAEQMLRSFR